MSQKQQRRASSLHALHRDTPRKTRFTLLEHAEVKTLLHTDPQRLIAAIKRAGLGCLMQWPYYADLKTSDREAAHAFRALAAAQGLPERLE